jgi:formylglycine-generating enzyme required for sulfatase activity
MPEQPRVFLSHTSELADWPAGKSCVQAALDAIREAGLVGRDMRDFPAAGITPSQIDREELDRCQIYVGILGFKYGMPTREDPLVSYTQQEFRYAREKGYSLLLFLLHEDTNAPASITRDLQHGAQQEAFRQEVLNSPDGGITCQFFQTADELQRLVVRSLQAELQRNWIRVAPTPSGDSEAAYNAVLQHLAAGRVSEWEQACRGDQQDRLEYYVPPHYAVLRDDGERRPDGLERVVTGRHASEGQPGAVKRPDRTEHGSDDYQLIFQDGDTADQELGRLLAGRPRLCISEDAGAGKSVFTRRVLSFACTTAGQQAVFGGLPGLVLRFEQWEQDWPRNLRAAIERELKRGCDSAAIAVDLSAMVNWLLQQGRVLLLLDGLDQVQNEAAIGAVSEFLTGEGQRCRAIVTGRPYRIFQGRSHLLRSSAWQFARIEGFNDQQIAEYLRGYEVGKVFPNLESVRDLIRIPSVLRIVRELLESGAAVQSFSSRGELYQTACSRLILNAGQRVDLAFDRRRARRLEQILAAIAFSMMVLKLYGAAARGESLVNSVERAAERRRPGGISDDEWRAVQQISHLTNHCILEGTREEMLSWQHRGMMEYYCGLHLACYAGPDCLRQAAEFAGDPEWSWAWRFAIELPGDAAEQSVRTNALALLFCQPEQHRRPTELMYRAWRLLEASADGRSVLQRFRDDYREQLKLKIVLQELEGQFVLCPPGGGQESCRFLMGARDDDKESLHDEKPPIEVDVQPFAMQTSPVTVEQFAAFDTAYQRVEQAILEQCAPHPECPAIRISWYDAWCFAAWTGSRLPREYEWEFACRAGTETRYWWGQDPDESRCTFRSNATTPATEAHANPWGLMEMSGNVWEWCQDWYAEDLRKTYRQEFEGTIRVLRGGSFHGDGPDFLRSAFCSVNWPGNRNYVSGFRLSRTT